MCSCFWNKKYDHIQIPSFQLAVTLSQSLPYVLFFAFILLFSLRCFIFFSFGHGLQSSWHQPVLSWNTGGSAFITIYSVYDANICSNKPITFLKLCQLVLYRRSWFLYDKSWRGSSYNNICPWPVIKEWTLWNETLPTAGTAKGTTVMSFRSCAREYAHFWNRIFFIRDLRCLRPCSLE